MLHFGSSHLILTRGSRAPTHRALPSFLNLNGGEYLGITAPGSLVKNKKFFSIVNFDQEIIHPGRIVSFTGEREHTFDDLFDYDWETKTTCWGSSAQCRIDCNRNGNTYTIWDRAYSFRQGNHQLTFTMVFFYDDILNFI